MLENGDKIQWSNRYRNRVKGVVKILSKTDTMVFLESPTLPDEDVAFCARDLVHFTRESIS